MMKLGENVINWYSWIENRLPMENVLIYLFDKFNYLFRNNCFGLSVEDSDDCCRTA